MKKLFAVLLTVCLLASGVSALAETVALKVWGSQDDQAMLGEMVEAFKAANPDKTYDINYVDIEKGRSNAGNIQLQDGDVLIIPQRGLFE